jgi:hypothetical protein
MTNGIYVRYHSWDDTLSVLMNLIWSQCVVAVVKRLKLLATCRKIWLAVSLVTNRPEEWTYLPPLVFGFSCYLIRRVGIRVAGQPGVQSCSRSTDVRPAHWMCVWSCSRLWWLWSTSQNERQTVASERSLEVPSVWIRFTLAKLKFDSGIVRFSRKLRLLDPFAT